MYRHNLLRRFWAKIDKRGEHDCWNWLGYKNPQGYGQMKINGETKVHRAMYAMTRTIPEGTIIMHTCNNPSCVNPKHLFAGSYADNVAHMYASGRDNFQANGPMFYEGEVWLMKKLENAGIRLNQIAEMFKAKPRTIRRILRADSYNAKELQTI